MYYLLKSEPDDYSYQDLEREKETDWTGVANPQAVKNLAQMKKGDQLVIYHTGKVRAAVGVARVVSTSVTDPKKPMVRIVAVGRIAKVKALDEIKQQSVFKDSPLVRQGRLSVVPLTEAQYSWLTGE
jgi:predicted RNA-binding protein with PUA-like domain